MNPGKIAQFIHMCAAILEAPILKAIGALIMAVLSFLFDGLLKEAMMALFILIMFDFVTAIMAVRRTPGEKIESRRLWVTGGKIAAYYMLISAGNLAEHSMQDALRFIDEAILGSLAATELLSILENVGRMGYAVPKKVIKKLSEYRDSK